jgi:hypothetical protein
VFSLTSSWNLQCSQNSICTLSIFYFSLLSSSLIPWYHLATLLLMCRRQMNCLVESFCCSCSLTLNLASSRSPHIYCLFICHNIQHESVGLNTSMCTAAAISMVQGRLLLRLQLSVLLFPVVNPCVWLSQVSFGTANVSI